MPIRLTTPLFSVKHSCLFELCFLWILEKDRHTFGFTNSSWLILITNETSGRDKMHVINNCDEHRSFRVDNGHLTEHSMLPFTGDPLGPLFPHHYLAFLSFSAYSISMFISF